MANDEPISHIIDIEDGSDAVAKTLRQNFKYLDDRITTQATNVLNKETLSNKNKPNGYCGLDANGYIPETILTNVTSSIVGAIYPVSSIYVTTDTNSTTCPIASLIPGSTWELVAADNALWTGNGSNANTTIPAGLPNHTHTVSYTGSNDDNGDPGNYIITSPNQKGKTYTITSSNAKGSSVYGQSSTVQPPAYVVNVWRRTA
jgi:hypothetical protein